MVKKKPIKLNDQQLMLMAGNVSDIYHQLSDDLFDNVVDRLKERGTYYLDKEPYLWQLEKMTSIGMLNDQNVKLMAEYSGIAEEQIRNIIENEGYKVYTDTMEQLGSNEYDNQVMEDLISYSNQAINDVTNLINTTLPKSVISAYQGIIEKTIAKVVTGMATSETALHETIMEWHGKGFYGYTDRAGRRQRADSYARTVIKTTVARVNNEMRTRPAEELGIDTFYYSIKAAAREMCAPIQHKIVTTGKARTEAGHKIYALSDYGYGRPEGCRGINCNHIMTPFIPGVNYLPDIEEHLKSLTPEQAIENANAQAKQRALERSIRFTKEQIHVAEKLGDMELIDRYKMKLGNQKHALKSFLDEHKFLYRDRDREKYYEDPLGVAKEEIRQRKEFIKREQRYFRSIEDPAADYYGSAWESNPERVQEIIANLDKIGVKVIEQNRNVFGYSPGAMPGTAGKITISKKASLSAWEHENLHAMDDYDAGFSGFRIFQDKNEHWRREKRAYDLEINMAKRLKNLELVDKLKLNKTKEWNRIFRGRDLDD
ncbi:TPA: phage minor capsid protein [Streptococcus suis]|nr:phage minor capsid protein [Streptococcus suis]